MIIPYISLLTLFTIHIKASPTKPLLRFHDEPEPDQHSVIVGGQEVDPIGRYSYIVSMQSDSFGHFCGGSLIDSEWVLSAAHCAGYATHVEIGRHNLANGGESYESLQVEYEVVHPGFDSCTLSNDVMLVKLKEPSSYTPVALNNETNSSITENNADVTVMGWGTTSRGGSTSDVLLEVELDVVSNDICNDQYGNEEITNDMMCAARDGKDSCQGDSGGPLIKKGSSVEEDVQVGIVSWGYGCADPRYSGVYSRVSYLYDWIIENQNTYAPTLSMAPTTAPTPCPDGTGSIVSVQIKTDMYPEEVSWELKSGGVLIDEMDSYDGKNYLYTHYYCVSSEECIDFKMVDSFGDGICCDYGEGYYEVYKDQELIASGGADFRCETTSTCEDRNGENDNGNYGPLIDIDAAFNIFRKMKNIFKIGKKRKVYKLFH